LFLGGRRSTLQIVFENALGIQADINHPVLIPLALADQDSSLGQIEILEAQVGHFFHPQPTPQHQHEDRPVPELLDLGKEPGHFFVLQVPW